MNEKQREQAKLRMQKMRNKKSVTRGSVTKEDVTQEMVPASYVEGVDGKMYEMLPERPRYLPVQDVEGVVYYFDRLNQPEVHASGDFILRMQCCNESAYTFRPLKQKARSKAPG